MNSVYIKIKMKTDSLVQAENVVKRLEEKGFSPKNITDSNGCFIYVECPSNKKYEVISVRLANPDVEEMTEVNTRVFYEVFTCGATKQDGFPTGESGPFVFAFVPIKKIATVDTDLSINNLISTYKSHGTQADGIMVKKVVADNDIPEAVLSSVVISVYCNCNSES